MDKRDYPLKVDISEEINQPTENEVHFYLEEMQKMNNQIIDMQRELSRALRESKRMQEELRHSDELKRALAAAEEANRAKMDFLSRMSHDLRTPMNVIMGLCAATLDDAESPCAVRENMANIRSASDYMLGIINDILDMAKLERGPVELRPEPYSYNEFRLEATTMFQSQCQAKGIRFVCEDLPANPTIMADKLRFKQVIFNIISNSVKYTPVGGCITVDARAISQKQAKNRVTIECRVTDSGIGMSEAFQQHMFEPFAQEDTTVRPELKGTGLGLSITKRLVEQMGGSICVESQKGKGTTVTLLIPFELAPEHYAANRPREMDEEAYCAILQGKCVLLAEDHPMNAMIARNLLEKKQMTVLHAENGRLAVDLFSASPVGSIDAILMDILMPEMSGLEAAKTIRALDRADATRVPILALSANAYADDVDASLAAGMNAHLAKPVDAAVLYRALARCIGDEA